MNKPGLKVFNRAISCARCGKRAALVDDDGVMHELSGALFNPFRTPSCPHCGAQVVYRQDLITTSAVRVPKPAAPEVPKTHAWALSCPHCEQDAYFCNERPFAGKLFLVKDWYKQDGSPWVVGDKACPHCAEELTVHTTLVRDRRPKPVTAAEIAEDVEDDS